MVPTAWLLHAVLSASATLHSLGTSNNTFYRLAEIPGSGGVVGATYDGDIVAYAVDSSPKGPVLRELWNESLGDAFGFSIVVGNIDSDNTTQEVVVGTASGAATGGAAVMTAAATTAGGHAGRR